MSEKLTITVPATDDSKSERGGPKAFVIKADRPKKKKKKAKRAPSVTIPTD